MPTRRAIERSDPERDRAAQRPGRRDRAGAPQGEPSERSERPALEGNEQTTRRHTGTAQRPGRRDRAGAPQGA